MPNESLLLRGSLFRKCGASSKFNNPVFFHHQNALKYRQLASNYSNSPPKTENAVEPDSTEEPAVNVRLNPVQIKMIPEFLHAKLFPEENADYSAIPKWLLDIIRIHHSKHEIPSGLSEKVSMDSKEVEALKEDYKNLEKLKVPDLLPGSRSISDHFLRMGSLMAYPIERLASMPLHTAGWKAVSDASSIPKEFSQKSGWTFYNPEKGMAPESVTAPLEAVLVFDVETCSDSRDEIFNAGVPIDPDDVNLAVNRFPCVAVCVSERGWYSWTSPFLFDGLETDLAPTGLNRLISIENPSNHPNRVIIGHNIGYDRARIRQEYSIKGTENSFIDTLSLHCAVCGLSSQQIPRYQKWKNVAKTTDMKKSKSDFDGFDGFDVSDGGNSVAGNEASEFDAAEKWLEEGSLNSLKACVEKHLSGEVIIPDESAEDEAPEDMKKTVREDILIKGTHSEVREHFQKVMYYCAVDVILTLRLYQVLLKKFKAHCPHPVTFYGMTKMSSGILPTFVSQWNDYKNRCESSFQSDQALMQHLLNEQAKDLLNRYLHMLENDLKIDRMHLTEPNDNLTAALSAWFERDPWIAQLDWTPRYAKYTKAKFKKDGTYTKKGMPRPIGNTAVFGLPKWYLDITVNGKSVEKSKNDSKEYQEKVHEKEEKEKATASETNETENMTGEPKVVIADAELTEKSEVKDEPEFPPPIQVKGKSRLAHILCRFKYLGKPIYFLEGYGWCALLDLKSWDSFIQEKLSIRDKEQIEQIKSSCVRLNLVFDDVDGSYKIINNSSSCSSSAHNQSANSNLPKFILQRSSAGEGASVKVLYKIPHPSSNSQDNIGSFFCKTFLPVFEKGILSSCPNVEGDASSATEAGEESADSSKSIASVIMNIYSKYSYWIGYSKRVRDQIVIPIEMQEGKDDGYGAIIPGVIPMGTISRRAVEKTWMTASNSKKGLAGSELKSQISSPPGYKFVGADVDSEELWIAGLFGESPFGGIHGASAIGWMTLQGTKQAGTDLHSKTAKILGLDRNDAKVFNYSRIYGAGVKHALQLLSQISTDGEETKDESIDKKMERLKETAGNLYAATKGSKKNWTLFPKLLAFNEFSPPSGGNGYQPFNKRPLYVGGTESYLFNYLEDVANDHECRTPVLSCAISEALKADNVNNQFLTSRMNWVVQSSAVDFLHCLLVSVEYLFKVYGIKGRLGITIHDEIRYLVADEDSNRAGLALQIAHLWTRTLFSQVCGMKDLPMAIAFFSLIDVDHCLRKEVDQPCITPTQKEPIKPGNCYSMNELLKMTDGSLGDVVSKDLFQEQMNNPNFAEYLKRNYSSIQHCNQEQAQFASSHNSSYFSVVKWLSMMKQHTNGTLHIKDKKQAEFFKACYLAFQTGDQDLIKKIFNEFGRKGDLRESARSTEEDLRRSAPPPIRDDKTRSVGPLLIRTTRNKCEILNAEPGSYHILEECDFYRGNRLVNKQPEEDKPKERVVMNASMDNEQSSNNNDNNAMANSSRNYNNRVNNNRVINSNSAVRNIIMSVNARNHEKMINHSRSNDTITPVKVVSDPAIISKIEKAYPKYHQGNPAPMQSSSTSPMRSLRPIREETAFSSTNSSLFLDEGDPVIVSSSEEYPMAIDDCSYLDESDGYEGVNINNLYGQPDLMPMSSSNINSSSIIPNAPVGHPSSPATASRPNTSIHNRQPATNYHGHHHQQRLYQRH